jgi:hypothetical protein
MHDNEWLAPRNAGNCCAQFGALTGLVSEPRRLVVLDHGATPRVGGRLLARHTVEQPWENAERCPSPRCVDCFVNKGANRAGFAQPQRHNEQPRQKIRVLTQSLILIEDRHGRAYRLDALARVASEDQCHAGGRSCKEP